MELKGRADLIAPALLGCLLIREEVCLRITEVEALGGLELRAGLQPTAMLAGPRLGIGFSSAEDRARPWRLADASSSAVLRKQDLALWVP